MIFKFSFEYHLNLNQKSYSSGLLQSYFQRQSQKMDKHTQAIRRQQPTNFLRVSVYI